MNKIAAFEKVTLEQMMKDVKPDPNIGAGFAEYLKRAMKEQGPGLAAGQVFSDFVKDNYEMNVMLPRRATEGSAGYDICSPIGVEVKAGEPFKIATGLRCWIADGWVLMIMPRSGLAFRHGLRLVNTAGIIDSDYYRADNEGHIMLKMVADDSFTIAPGDRIAQGIFVPYGITTNDDVILKERTGGFGSTGQ